MVFYSSKGPLYYECSGNADHTAILFLHALGSNHHLFDDQSDRLQDAYYVIKVDLPWHGASYHPDHRLDFDEITLVLKELLDHLKVESACVSGVSLGGYLAQHLAFMHPERVEAVHMNGAHPLHMDFNRFIQAAARVHSAITHVLPKWMIYMMTSVILSTDKPSRHMVKSHFKNYARRHLIHLSEGAKYGLLKGIDKPLGLPMLMTIGEQEFGFIRRRCEKWASIDDESVLQEVSGGNHLHITQYPQASEAMLRGFIEGLKDK